MENVRGRERVEAGEACLRKNGRGVDTNRNWAVHWGHKERDYDPEEEYPGDRPFRWGALCTAGTHHKLHHSMWGSRFSDVWPGPHSNLRFICRA